MTEERKQEIINNLQSIVDASDEELSMFELISTYNKDYNNKELIGGSWARENGFDLP